MEMVEVLFFKTGPESSLLMERRGQEMAGKIRDCCMNGIQFSITLGEVTVIESKPLVAALLIQFQQGRSRQLVIRS